MTFSHRIRIRLIRRVALGLAVAAVVAPSAQAISMPAPELYQHAGPVLGAGQAYGELFQFTGAGLDSTRPDDRAARPGTIASEPIQPVGTPASARDSEPGGTAVDWRDAGAGIGIGAAVSLLLAGGAALLMRQRGGLAQA